MIGTKWVGVVALLSVAFAQACGGGDSPPGDGSTDGARDSAPDAPVTCSSDASCDDGVFCNGAEVCRPADPSAGAQGCIAAVVERCMVDQTCNEASARCETECDVNSDADGDGSDALSCGGDDCDDSDPGRFPGRPEVCDVADKDEDCDPRTFGIRDNDGDGSPDALCCNVDPSSGDRLCGDDCDDTRGTVSPTNTEACDTIDNDCDSSIDEGTLTTYYEDSDGDSFGSAAADAPTMTACLQPSGYSSLATDCDDAEASVHPAAAEACDVAMVDENCDGVSNPDTLCNCTGTESRGCMMTSGVCTGGIESCVGGAWGDCSISAGAEVCDESLDEDCDGLVDEGLTTGCYNDSDGDGYAAAGAALVDRCAVTGRESVGGCPVGTTNRGPTLADIDCNDDSSAVSPGASEVCIEGLSVDDDCDGSVDEGVSVMCFADLDNDTYSPGGPATRRCRDVTRPAVGFCPVNTTNRDPTGAFDCDDGAFNINPTATEVCDGLVDENCDGAVDEGCTCSGAATRSCADGGLLGDCAAGIETCSMGSWGDCSISVEVETCNTEDDDCDGAIDEGLLTRCWTDGDGDTYAPSGATFEDRCGACLLGFTSREPAGADVDCDDGLGTVHPGAAEVCDRLDSDCSSGGGAAVAEDSDGDGHTSPSYADCTGGFPKDDCHDGNEDVFFGQSEYFTLAYCPAGSFSSATCTAGLCRTGGPGGSCTTTASWDYSCNMAVERDPPVTGCSGSCSLSPCPSRSGPTYSGTPACGSFVSQRSCGCGGGFSCSWFSLRSQRLGCH